MYRQVTTCVCRSCLPRFDPSNKELIADYVCSFPEVQHSDKHMRFFKSLKSLKSLVNTKRYTHNAQMAKRINFVHPFLKIPLSLSLSPERERPRRKVASSLDPITSSHGTPTHTYTPIPTYQSQWTHMAQIWTRIDHFLGN